MATKSQEILLKGNTTNASAVPSSLKVREIAINALDRSLFTNDGNSIVKLYTGTTKWFDVNGNANNALKLGGILASEYINKETFNSHINNSIIHITSEERTKWNNKWDYNEETIKGVKVNAAVLSDKATKLATARTLWGRPFDGSANVSGDLTNVGNITASGKATIQGDIVCGGEVVAIAGEGTPVGVTDYSALTGKPQINGVTLLSGNNTLAALGIQAAGDYATNSGVTTLLANYADKTFVSNNYVGKSAFNSHTADTDIHITAAERVAWNAKWDYNEATIKAVKVTSASSADKLNSNAGTSAIPIYFDGGIPVQCTPSSLFYGFANGYDASAGGRVLGITIAGYTRKVVVAYSTLAGSAAKLETARTIWGQSFDGSANVSGDLYLSGYKLVWLGNENYSIYMQSDGQAYYKAYDGHRFFTYGSVERLKITSGGNILIGTTTDNGYKLDVNGKGHYSGDLIVGGEVVAVAGEGTPAGVTDYSALTGKPAINGVTLVSGNNTLASLGIQAAGDYATNSGVTTLLADYAKKTFVSNNYVGKAAFNSHIADTYIHITASERTAWNAKWDYNEATIKAVKVTSASSADSVAWTGIKDKPTTFTPSAHTHTASEVSGLPTSLKNPYALTFGSKTYDGSAAATITASDLGALTAHQSIYAFTLQVNGISQGVYNPTSAAKTINIAVPTKTSDITNDSGFITSAAIPTALKNPYAVEIKANGVSLGTYDGSEAATFNLSAANVGAANKVHSHTASEISGLPTKLSAFTNDVGYITGITKSMVEGVLTGNITSHTHSQYLTSALRPAKYATTNTYTSGYYKIKINSTSKWMLSFDVKIYQDYASCTIRFSGYNYINAGQWYRQSASIIDGQNNIGVKFGYDSANSLWVAIPAGYYTGISITNVANGYAPIDTYALDQLFTITYEAELSGTTQATITIYPPSKSDHTHTFASLTSKPTTIAGYGITDALTTSNYNSYAPTLTGTGASGTWGINISGNAASADVVSETYANQSINFAHNESKIRLISSASGNASENGFPIQYVGGISAISSYVGWQMVTYGGYDYPNPFFRNVVDSNTWTAWKQIAFLTDNVASATKLQTPRTLWGRSFDGSGDVSGAIIGCDYIKNNEDVGGYYIGSRGKGLGTGSEEGLLLWVYGQRKMSFYTNRTNRMEISTNGNVLIGTTTDNGYRLQVAGSERVYGDLIVDGEVSALVA